MARLIDADALRETMYHEAFETDTDMQRWDGGCWIRYKMFENALKNAPTIDAVEVVRCKDCKYNWVTSYNHGVQDDPRCKFTSYKLSLNDYCSIGERK